MRSAMRGVASAMGRLPEPDAQASAISAQVVQQVRRFLSAGQTVSFARFMELALYMPGVGYYANGLAKFGPEGDFVTAPEISPLFGRCVGRQVAEVLLRLGQGSVLELGAGSGALAEALLGELERLDVLPERYCILEPSAALQARQKARLAESLPAEVFARVVWLSRLPQGFVGVMLANEVVDALPVEVLRLFEDDAQQAYVRWDEAQQRLDWDWHKVSDAPAQQVVDGIRQLLGQSLTSRGYVTEWCPVLPAWMASLSDALAQGAVLLVDYGYARREYYSPARWMGTLRAHYRQRAHQEVFWYPGLQDLTAHVDFTAVAEAGHDAGLTLAGFTTQANFLLGLGIVDMVDPQADVVTHLKLAQQIKTLTMPDEMGESFKAMAFVRGVEGALSGFSLRDLRATL